MSSSKHYSNKAVEQYVILEHKIIFNLEVVLKLFSCNWKFDCK